jgi:hypothetical protein
MIPRDAHVSEQKIVNLVVEVMPKWNWKDSAAIGL